MLSQAENDRLTQVGRGTPMGELMRRYWIPVCTSTDLEAGGAPRRARLLGEDLVAFRGDDGSVGVMEESCPHRGASLMLARNEDCALQCLYHGWKIAADGTILDMPAEPEDSTFKNRFKHLAYPTRESGGVVWTYMGPADYDAPFFEWDWTLPPASHTMHLRAVGHSNWAQSVEGAVDSSHQTYLHDAKSRQQRDRDYVERMTREGKELTDGFDETGQIVRPWNDGRPRLQVEITDFGYRYAAIRRPLVGADRFKNVRVTQFVAPFFVLVPAPDGWGQITMHVPIDDETTMFWHVRSNLREPVDAGTLRVMEDSAGLVMGVDIDENLEKKATRANLWLQDRHEMKHGDRLSGIRGTIPEDQAVQESMGPRYDRRKEHLATSDMAVIRFRRIMLDAVRKVEEGGRALGHESTTDFRTLRGEESTIPLDTPWESVGVPT